MADCHVGSWRDPKLSWVSTEAFCRAIDASVERKVDFILISGDLFNTSVPAIDKIKVVAKKLKELKDRQVPVYIIAGSHDYSPTGKTMLDVLESADLLVNVTKGEASGEKLKLKFTVDKKTGAKITGILGRRNMLEKGYYESLDRESLEKETGFRIFMFHTGISELKPKELQEVECSSLSIFPKGFDYYAGGHVHAVMNQEVKGYGRIVYPGPLFPNSFHELEELDSGGFFIYEDGKMEFIPMKIFGTEHMSIDCGGKPPEKIREEALQKINSAEVQHKIVTLRLFGKMSAGRISDIDIRGIVSMLYSKKAYFVMRNTAKLEAEGFDEIKIQHSSVEEIEAGLVKEHLGQVKVEGMGAEAEKEMVLGMMSMLSSERNEGERVMDFEKRIREAVDRVMKA